MNKTFAFFVVVFLAFGAVGASVNILDDCRFLPAAGDSVVRVRGDSDWRRIVHIVPDLQPDDGQVEFCETF